VELCQYFKASFKGQKSLVIQVAFRLIKVTQETGNKLMFLGALAMQMEKALVVSVKPFVR
jgi:hypothetical protein